MCQRVLNVRGEGDGQKKGSRVGRLGKGKDPETTAAQADLSGGCDGDDVDRHPRHADIHTRRSLPVFY